MWNRLFHTKEVKANQGRKALLEKIIKSAPNYGMKIGDVTYIEGNPESVRVTGATSLVEVLNLHKEAWNDGFQNDNIGPCKYGMYRTEDVANMEPSEVFLGDIYGLFTKNIPFWEQYKNDGKTGGGFPIYEYLSVYQIVLRQYKHQLSSNIRAISENAKTELVKLKNLGY